MEHDTLLLIDDNPDNLFVLRELIADALPQCQVLTAPGAQAGLELARAHRPEGILLDVQMPGVGGIELCRQLKADPALAAVPVILMTAHSSSSSLKARGLEAGAEDFIAKPIDNIELIARIKVMLRMAHAEEALRRENERLEATVAERTRALAGSREQLDSILRTMSDVVWSVCARTGRVLHLNPAAETLYGQPLEVFLQDPRAWREQVRPEDRPALEEADDILREQGRWEGEYRIARPGGEVRTVFDRAVGVRDGEGRLLRIDRVITDLTERKRIEEQLRQTQKMEAIGQLAGGIAHDFNNLLTAILGYANLLRLESDPASSIHDSARTIEKAAERAAELTRQLLGFARRGKFLSVPVRLDEIVREVIALLGRTLDKSIRIETHLEAGEALAHGDPGQLEQAVLNLAVNARDAMPDGGELRFESALTSLDEETCRQHPGLVPGDYITLTVRDSGCGIPASIRERIFEPFFTTKEPGKGTGMGLAMVYGIVRNHGGAIRVESEEGRGTAFTLCLPLHGARPARPAEAPEPEDGMRRGSGRILLVDDEPVIRGVASQMLRSLGYEVLAAAGGREAAGLLEAHRETIDLAVIDMVMPEMDGRECFRALRRIRPDLPAILSSGYGLDGRAQQVLNEGMAGFVQKPYKLNELAEAIARAMGAGR